MKFRLRKTCVFWGLIPVNIGIFCIIYFIFTESLLKKSQNYNFNHAAYKTESCVDNICKYNQIHFTNKSTKKILLWTKFFNMEWPKEIATYLAKSRHNCTVTTDRNEIKSSDAILFHFLNLWVWESVPGYRTPEKPWILYNMEAPPGLHYTGFPWIRVFNWTMSYRRDSTIYSPYGKFEPLTPAELKKAAKMYSNFNFAKDKTKMAKAIISNCNDNARRYKLVEQLRKHVEVDFFGKCGNLSCSRSECVSKSYRFRIAFENANCREYVTEKFWNSILDNIIPVVNWKKEQAIDMPPHSYINMDDFNDAEHLGNYLKMLAQNDTLFNEYFRWRLKYKVVGGETMWYSFQHLCDALHTPRPAQTIVDPDVWLNNDTCSKFTITGYLHQRWDRIKFNWGL